MPRNDLPAVFRYARACAGPDSAGDLTDAELLGRFRADRDEAAFALLVQRHGPMVLGVCHRVLGNREQAEDAFQAAFVLLATRAAAIRAGGSLGGWASCGGRRRGWSARRCGPTSWRTT